MTTAGRFFVVLWSVKGNGTSTTSAKSKLVVFGIVVVVPDLLESRLRELGNGVLVRSSRSSCLKSTKSSTFVILSGGALDLVEQVFGFSCRSHHVLLFSAGFALVLVDEGDDELDDFLLLATR